MPRINHVSWKNLTRKELYSNHWYKELRTPEQRRNLYQLARQAGCDSYLARRIRDLSPNHAQSFIMYAIANKK